MSMQKREKIYGTERYMFEVILPDDTPPVIGHKIDRGHYGVHEVTSILPNGVCCGVDIRFKEKFRLKK